MRIQAYLRVVGDEATVRAIHEQTNVPRANIKQLKAPRNASGDEMWWQWATDSIDVDADDPDGGLKALLSKHTEIFPVIRRQRERLTSISKWSPSTREVRMFEDCACPLKPSSYLANWVVR